MAKLFDVGLETLAGAPLAAAADHPVAADGSAFLPASLTADYPPSKKSFYLETFGCQMNVHDSEKVAGVLLQRGYRSVSDPADADLVLYNTCSIREKAAQKIFARLGDWKTLSAGKIIGVLGCLASRKARRFSSGRPG